MRDETRWHETSDRTEPPDGQSVQVRVSTGAKPRPMIFRAKPMARWESLDGANVYQFRYFAQWRRAGSGGPFGPI